MIDHVATLMVRLPEPTPPATLKATVMARIAREAERQQENAAEASDPARTRRESPVWIWTLAGGLAAVVGVSIYGWIVRGSLPSFTSPLIGHGSPALIPVEGSAALIVGLGLVVYLAGLFAPLRARSNSPSRTRGRSLTSP